MIEAGKYVDALAHIVMFESDICDTLAVKEARGN